MSIVKKPFGVTPDGAPASLYVMTNTSGASVEICDYGGIIHAINVPDRDGKLGNVVLGYPSIEGYFPLNGYLGALIGRVGNRIANGKCEVSGQQLNLYCNENGRTHLHGGKVGFDSRFWEVTPIEGIQEDLLVLKLTSPDGEEGYPGTLRVMVTYVFNDYNELTIHYEAVSDRDTLCNLTNHTYFNLAGEASGKTIEDHEFEFNCDAFTPVDEVAIPTGEIRDVTGTVFDFREATRLGDRMEMTDTDQQLIYGKGFDHNFVINDDDGDVRLAARVRDPETGRTMDVFTDLPCVQFYAANFLKGLHPGTSGRVYQPHEGFCLETQFAPDSPNHPEFESCLLPAGEKFDSITLFSFDTDAAEEDPEA